MRSPSDTSIGSNAPSDSRPMASVQKNANAAAGRTSSRALLSGLLVCPPVAISGVLITRRSPATAAPTTSIGTARATVATTGHGSMKSWANQVPPSQATHVASECSTGLTATPTTAPATAASPVSAATIFVTCAGVAPASRSAARRRSRRAAVSRDADATSTRLGTSSTTTPTPASSDSSTSGDASPSPSAASSMASAGMVSGEWPTSTTSCSGYISASSPSRPAGVASKRSASSAAGRLSARCASSGDRSISPGAGSRSMPGGSATSARSTSGATSMRVMRCPSISSSLPAQLTVARSTSDIPNDGSCHRVRSARDCVANGRLTSRSTSPVATATPSAVSTVDTWVRRSTRSTRMASCSEFIARPPAARCGRRGSRPCAGPSRRARGRGSR